MSRYPMLTTAGLLLFCVALFALYSCGGGGTDTSGNTALNTLDGSGASASGTESDIATGDRLSDTDGAGTDTDVPRERHRQFKGGFPVVGEIMSLEDRVLTLKPEIPEEMMERLRASDRPVPEVPEEVKLRLTDDTKFKVGGEEVDGLPFGVGDKVVAWPGFSEEFDMRVARMVSDYGTFAERIRAWREGDHQFDGDHQWNFRRMMPSYGAITEITDSSITIAPEIPEWWAERMRRQSEEGGDVPQIDLPPSMTFQLDIETKFMRDGEQARPASFSIGDKVTVMPRRLDDSTPETDARTAAVVSEGAWFRHRDRDGEASRDSWRERWHDRDGGMTGDAA